MKVERIRLFCGYILKKKLESLVDKNLALATETFSVITFSKLVHILRLDVALTNLIYYHKLPNRF